MKRKCLIKRLYELATPYIQLTGWLMVVSSVILGALAIIQEVQAFDGRISALERAFIDSDKRLSVIDGKLDVVIDKL